MTYIILLIYICPRINNEAFKFKTMTNGKTSLKEFLEHGDIQKIVNMSGASKATVNRWLTDDPFRGAVSVKINAAITKAYAKIIISNQKARAQSYKILRSLRDE